MAHSRPRTCRPNFYPRSPCGERLAFYFGTQTESKFLSTLSLRRATQQRNLFHCTTRFLSTLSLRRATFNSSNYYVADIISIHALLAESDLSRFAVPQRCNLFLSTLSLRRATPKMPLMPSHALLFLSTLSLRRATQWLFENYDGLTVISIHALLAESD